MYFALLGKPESILKIIIKDEFPLILNNLYIIFLVISPKKRGIFKSISILPIIRKGNNDGNTLFFQILKE